MRSRESGRQFFGCFAVIGMLNGAVIAFCKSPPDFGIWQKLLIAALGAVAGLAALVAFFFVTLGVVLLIERIGRRDDP